MTGLSNSDLADVVFAGIGRQASLIARGELSPIELVECCLSRIEAVDPKLNAFRVVLAERAIEDARVAERRRAAGSHRPLLGVPLAVKDDVDLAGVVTAVGTCANERPAQADCEMVRRLREAGAIIIGKTNVPELTMWPWTESETWGVTRNPWKPNLSPGGSSGGSAVAVATGMVGAATGSDGLGSLRIPAACCGLFALKPQRDRVPLAPRHGDWHGLVHYGALTRTVADTALFLDVVGGPGRPGVFSAAARQPPPRLRVGLSTATPSRRLAPLTPATTQGLVTTAELLQAAGHCVIRVDVPHSATMTLNHMVRYLRGIADQADRLEHPDRLDRRSQAMAHAGARIPQAFVARETRRGVALSTRLQSVFEEVDVLLAPVVTVSALPADLRDRGSLRSLLTAGRFVPFPGAWNMTGQPAASVPAGMSSNGVPSAVQLVARPDQEATLLSLAAEIEALRPWESWRPPVS
jgi:amidase